MGVKNGFLVLIFGIIILLFCLVTTLIIISKKTQKKSSAFRGGSGSSAFRGGSGTSGMDIRQFVGAADLPVPPSGPNKENMIMNILIPIALSAALRPTAVRSALRTIAGILYNSPKVMARLGVRVNTFLNSMVASNIIRSRIASLSTAGLVAGGAKFVKSMSLAGRSLTAERAVMAAKYAGTTVGRTLAAALPAATLGGVYDAVAIVGMGLDLSNTGNLTKEKTTADWLRAAVENENTARQQFNDDQLIYPIVVGPLDDIDDDAQQLALKNEFFLIIADPPESGPVFSAVSNLISTLHTMSGRSGGVSTEDLYFVAENGYDALLSEDDLHVLMTEAATRLCTSVSGAPYIDVVGNVKCSYSTSDSCLNASTMKLPKDPNETEDTKYTEWRPKGWFDRLPGSSAPSQGACIQTDSTLYEACTGTIKTALGTSPGDVYDRRSGICQNSRATCEIYGANYHYGEVDNPSWNSGQPKLATCADTTAMNVVIALFGETLGRIIIYNAEHSITLDQTGYDANLNILPGVDVTIGGAGGIQIPGLTAPPSRGGGGGGGCSIM